VNGGTAENCVLHMSITPSSWDSINSMSDLQQISGVYRQKNSPLKILLNSPKKLTDFFEQKVPHAAYVEEWVSLDEIPTTWG